MNRILTTFLILIYTLTAICQETKLIIKHFPNSKQISESYSVLKSDKQTKHGEYISYFLLTEVEFNEIKKGTLKLEHYIKQKGNYAIGKKDGEWIEYSRPSILQTTGNYSNDKKVGIWATSKEQGQVLERYDFDNNKKLKPFIRVSVTNYPKSAVEHEVQGSVYVKYKINKGCSLSDIEVIKSLSNDCDIVATETVSQLERYLKKYSQNCDEKIDTLEVKFTLR